MPGFENYAKEADELEHQIARMGIALGIDWDDKLAVHAVAREALAYRPDQAGSHTSFADRAKLELFGLTQLMLKVMQDSAQDNMHTHGGPTWKILARALWAEAEAQGLVSERRKAPRSD